MVWVYIVRCADRTLYVGLTHDIDARLTKHNEGIAATYTAARRPVQLIYSEEHPTLSAAVRRERQIKRWSRAKKEALATGDLQLLKQL